MVASGRLGTVAKVAANALVENYIQIQEVFGPEAIKQLVGAMGVAISDESAFPDDMLLNLPRHLVDNVEEWTPGTVLGRSVQRIDALLKSVTADRWEEALSDGSPEVLMLLVRIEKANIKLTAKDYLEGYKRSALNVLAADHGADLAPEDWNKLYQAIPNSSRKVLATHLMMDIDRKGVKPEGAVEFIINYSELAAALPLDEYPESTMQIFLRELVLADDDTAKEYVRGNKKRLKKAVSKLRSSEATKDVDALAALDDAISSLEQSNDENAWASELRSVLGIPKKVEQAPIIPRDATDDGEPSDE